MVGIHYEQIKQKQLEIEVKALTALLEHYSAEPFRMREPIARQKVIARLKEIAFPLEIEIDDEDDYGVVFGDEA
jgi:hypothetical protein